MQRFSFLSQNLSLSYLDSGGEGEILIALHAHMMEAVTFNPLATILQPHWRLISLDQRGHGYSDHASSYTRDDYINDLCLLYKHLKIEKAVILGNSLGGVNAFQFAARYPKFVRGLIIEDIAAEIEDDMSFCLAWQGIFSSKESLENRIGSRFLPYFQDSIRQVECGWRLAFDPSEMMASNRVLCGNHWDDWLASDCPALLLRGNESRITTREQMERMTAQRNNTEYLELNAGHVIHQDNFKNFATASIEFLQKLN
ncbi:alpha/beta fold hydrolase [Silvanigrella aquatica]|uniref:AB hydrolase-1 domain-containing protein n=1 Tax=Silvanigrella aquatica TaxID=1915309 RepID=A0A1L4D0H1_9BACT|nr:alpha/beta hydrolase [Silvanigrella aquatica]APJ03680.1 hypothetical protein AXG55_07085 [Silvanigrella aquatica]